MTELDDNNFDSTLSTIFQEGKTAVVFYGQPNCQACHKTFDNYTKVKKELSKNTFFYYVDFTKCWIPESRYSELQKFNEYPKVLIFNGTFADVDFREGLFTEEDFRKF